MECLQNWFAELEREICGIGWSEIPAFEVGFDILKQLQTEDHERRLETIRDVLSAVIKPVSEGFLLAIHQNLGDGLSQVFKKLFQISHHSAFSCS